MIQERVWFFFLVFKERGVMLLSQLFSHVTLERDVICDLL